MNTKKLVKNALACVSDEEQKKILEKVEELVVNGHFYEDTHLHSKDQFKADNSPKKVVAKYQEMGRNAVYLTQYGVAAMTWDFKEAVLGAGLKFIPGVETDYQENATLNQDGLMEADSLSPVSKIVLHALNDKGWKAISMAISASQTVHGKSLMNDEILGRYFGEGSVGYHCVVATHPGIEGPVSQILKQETLAEETVDKIRQERDRKTGGIIPQSYFDKLKNKIEELTDEEEDIKEQKKVATKNKDKEIIQSLEEVAGRLKKRISALKKELKEFEKLAEENQKYEEKIAEVSGQLVSQDDVDSNAKNKLNYFNDVFGKGNFFAEIHYHGSKEEERILPKVVAFSKELDIPLLAANDIHMLDDSEEEQLKRQILKTIEFPNDPKWFELTPAEKQMYIKTGEEIRTSLLTIYSEDEVQEGLLNTLILTERANLEFKSENHHPKFVDDTGRDTNQIFKDLINDGISKRFPEGLDDTHKQRLKHEVDVMESMGYVDYHLVVNDFNQYASEYDAVPFDKIPEAPLRRDELKKWKKEHGFEKPVGLTNGTGRGSAVGSLVCDLLGITHLDPMKYELLFERFLNPERVSMPDIDSDISRTVRPIVIEYVRDKYGKDCVAGIITQNSQAPKGAIRIAAKAYGLYLNRFNYKDNGAKQFLSLADMIAKQVPEAPGITFASKISEEDDRTIYQYLEDEFADNEDAQKILQWSSYIEGCFTAYGSHAAGIVITDGTPVSEIVPLRWNDKLKLYTTQCDMIVAEEIGMLKFDMLGLKTVDIINDTLWEMNKSGVLMDTNALPLDDKEVYANIFAKGKTDSVFQFESSGMKQMLKRFQPESFEDLIILVSMFRPGPLQYLDDVIEVKHGRKPLKFLTPELEPILGATYGAITYQEQVMQIFQQLAGYTLGGADLVRRFMSKKKADKLAKEREAFINGDASRGIIGCVGNGIDKEAAGKLFDQMTEFAKYAFNKSHAAAYAYNAYITGYLKYHYPAEFMMAAMRWAEKKGSHDPIPGLMAEAKSLGIEVLPPDINHSGVNFNVENGRILFGLGSVASVASYGDEIVEERKNGKYLDFFDYFKRTRAKKDSTKNLILAGAFDGFHNNRKAMLEIVEPVQALVKKIKEKDQFVKAAEKLLPYVDSVKEEQALKDLQEELGIKKILDKETTSEKLQKRIDNANAKIKELSEELSEIHFAYDLKEDLVERLNAEKKFIGAYVTGHPMDSYESAESLEVTTVSEIDEETTEVYGLITAIDERKRKKDGKPMAFITLEDKIAAIKVNVFSGAYAQHKSILEEGVVVRIEGATKVEYNEDEVNYVFNAKKIVLVDKKQNALYCNVSSLALFHLFEEEDLRKKYESPLGVPFYVYDQALNEIRLMKYKMLSNAIAEKNIKDGF